ncbi:hypothetical protein INR49_023039 [Caranx melampygus]|nr:hypothetical protein INR49_023039 [Caranx melampygus]
MASSHVSGFTTHQWRLWRSKLLGHQRLRPTHWWRRRKLAKLSLWLARLILTSTTTSLAVTGVVSPTAAVPLVLI